MTDNTERNLGTQPIQNLMTKHTLRPNDLVIASDASITHKMVTKACKGRRLNPGVQEKILHALNRAAESEYTLDDLFNYAKPPKRTRTS